MTTATASGADLDVDAVPDPEVPPAPLVSTGWCGARTEVCRDVHRRCGGVIVNGEKAAHRYVVCPCRCHSPGQGGVLVTEDQRAGSWDPQAH